MTRDIETPTDLVAIYCTVPDNEAGTVDLPRQLVATGLIACVNVFRGVHSTYRWEGEVVVDEPEAVLIAKTKRSHLPAAMTAIHEAHPYETPCVVAYPAEAALADYTGWVGLCLAPADGER